MAITYWPPSANPLIPGGSGTAGKLAKWTTSTMLGDSIVSESADILSIIGATAAATVLRIGSSGTGLSQISAGVLGIGTGAAGSVAGTLQAARVDVGANTKFYGTYANLPTLIGGTGTASVLTLQSTEGVGATDSIDFKVGNNGGTLPWRITNAGHLIAPTDNTFDIGASGATRPRNVYVAAAVFAGSDFNTTASVVAGNNRILMGAGHDSGNGRIEALTSRGLEFGANNTLFGLITSAGSWGIGPSNTSPTGTLHVANLTPTTGATLVTIAKGAADTVATNTLSSDASALFSGTVVADNFKRGAGSPESAVVGSVGDVYLRTDGGANTTLYVKESGAATNTGWIAK